MIFNKIDTNYYAVHQLEPYREYVGHISWDYCYGGWEVYIKDNVINKANINKLTEFINSLEEPLEGNE